MRAVYLLALVAIIATVLVSGSDVPTGPIARAPVGPVATAPLANQPRPVAAKAAAPAPVARAAPVAARPLPAVAKSAALPPCKKAKKTKLLSIEQRYPTLVKDYHPIDNAIDPNAIKGRDADRIARVIIREHLEWERENPEPPAQLSTTELKDLSNKLAQETEDIKKEEKAFKALSKFVDDDHTAYDAAEKARVAKLAEAEKQKAKDAAEKVKTAAMLKSVAAQRAAVAAQKAAADKARASAKKTADAKSGAKLTAQKAPAPIVAKKVAVPVAVAKKTNAASNKINTLKVKAAAPVSNQAKSSASTSSAKAATRF